MFGLKTWILERARHKDDVKSGGGLAKKQTAGENATVDLLYQAIRRAEANENKMAQQMLATLLKQNPRNG